VGIGRVRGGRLGGRQRRGLLLGPGARERLQAEQALQRLATLQGGELERGDLVPGGLIGRLPEQQVELGHVPGREDGSGGVPARDQRVEGAHADGQPLLRRAPGEVGRADAVAQLDRRGRGAHLLRFELVPPDPGAQPCERGARQVVLEQEVLLQRQVAAALAELELEHRVRQGPGLLRPGARGVDLEQRGAQAPVVQERDEGGAVGVERPVEERGRPPAEERIERPRRRARDGARASSATRTRSRESRADAQPSASRRSKALAQRRRTGRDAR
jgi:hypothetical protein